MIFKIFKNLGRDHLEMCFTFTLKTLRYDIASIKRARKSSCKNTTLLFKQTNSNNNPPKNY